MLANKIPHEFAQGISIPGGLAELSGVAARPSDLLVTSLDSNCTKGTISVTVVDDDPEVDSLGEAKTQYEV